MTYRQKLEDLLARCAFALWTMVVRNRRTTALGVAAAVGLLSARYGFDLTPEQLERLAAGVIIFIGLVAGDTHRRGKRS